MSEITIPNAAEMLERTVKPVGGGAQVHVPKKWIGRHVAVVLVESKPRGIEMNDIIVDECLDENIDWGGDARTPQH